MVISDPGTHQRGGGQEGGRARIARHLDAAALQLGIPLTVMRRLPSALADRHLAAEVAQPCVPV